MISMISHLYLVTLFPSNALYLITALVDYNISFLSEGIFKTYHHPHEDRLRIKLVINS